MSLSVTSRELLLVLGLFLALVSVSRPNSVFNVYKRPSTKLHGSEALPSTPTVIPTKLRSRLSWSGSKVPFSAVVAHVPGELCNIRFRPRCSRSSLGWTIVDNLYLLNGTIYIVTDDSTHLPPHRDNITSTGVPIQNGLEAEHARQPTDRDLQIIGSKHASKLFGKGADIIDGVTVGLIINTSMSVSSCFQFYANDPSQLCVEYLLLALIA